MAFEQAGPGCHLELIIYPIQMLPSKLGICALWGSATRLHSYFNTLTSFWDLLTISSFNSRISWFDWPNEKASPAWIHSTASPRNESVELWPAQMLPSPGCPRLQLLTGIGGTTRGSGSTNGLKGWQSLKWWHSSASPTEKLSVLSVVNSLHPTSCQ